MPPLSSQRIWFPASLAIGIVAIVVLWLLGSRSDELEGHPKPTPGALPVSSRGAIAALPPASGETGSIEGVVRTDRVFSPPGRKLGTDPACNLVPEPLEAAEPGVLADAVVQLLVDLPQTPVPKEPVVIDQRGCRFIPHVQVAVRGQEIQIKNSDATLHNVHAYRGSNRQGTIFNQAQPPRSAPIKKVAGDAPSIINLRCDVHPWMSAYIAVAQNPFFAVTDRAGRFTIGGVPAGSYRLSVWHEALDPREETVVVRPGETAHISTKLP